MDTPSFLVNRFGGGEEGGEKERGEEGREEGGRNRGGFCIVYSIMHIRKMLLYCSVLLRVISE